MAVGNSAKHQWASLNKHFLSNTSLVVILIANTCLYVGK